MPDSETGAKCGAAHSPSRSVWSLRLSLALSIFTIDLGLKLIGQGPLTFARHLLNWIDVVVVVSGIVDISNLISVHTCYSTESENPYACEGASLVNQLLRGLRLVRLAKLVRFFPNLRCVYSIHTNTHTHTHMLSW